MQRALLKRTARHCQSIKKKKKVKYIKAFQIGEMTTKLIISLEKSCFSTNIQNDQTQALATKRAG